MVLPNLHRLHHAWPRVYLPGGNIFVREDNSASADDVHKARTIVIGFVAMFRPTQCGPWSRSATIV